MRLGIFVASIVALILVSRFYMSSTEELSESESVPSVAMAVYDEPVKNRIAFVPGRARDSLSRDESALGHAVDSVKTFSKLKPVLALASTASSTRHLSSASSRSECSSVATSKLGDNATNVQLLVRAQYEIPRKAAGLLMQLDTDTLVETTELESGHPDVVILQVTTDEETQKQFSGFLSALYPPESMQSLRSQSVPAKDGTSKSAARESL